MSQRRAPKRDTGVRSRIAHRTTAGALLFLAGAVFLMGVITAEALYPADYSTSTNEISDLGATRPPNSVILQPSATIFDTTMIATGLAIVVAAYCLQRVFGRYAATIPLALLGVGALGVGVFPGNYAIVHPLLAMLAFVAGGLAAILSYTVVAPPLRYLSIALGAVSLATLILAIVLGDSGPIGLLGDGGAERWVAYPIVLWLTVFGGYLMSRPQLSDN
jgi:hypothetical membrane protein